MIQAGSRMPSLAATLAVVATTDQMQTGPSASPGSLNVLLYTLTQSLIGSTN